MACSVRKYTMYLDVKILSGVWFMTCNLIFFIISIPFGDREEAGVELSKIVFTVRKHAMVLHSLWKNKYHLLGY